MTREDVLQSIGEIAVLMSGFSDDRRELLNLTARMRVRLDQLEAHATAGRPDLKAAQR